MFEQQNMKRHDALDQQVQVWPSGRYVTVIAVAIRYSLLYGQVRLPS